MGIALINRRLRQLHLWLGLAIGAQVVIWLASGLLMTIFPIETVRGNPLRSPAEYSTISFDQVSISSLDAAQAALLEPTQITLKQLQGRPVWLIEALGDKALVTGDRGNIISPLSEGWARSIAQTGYAGRGDITGMTYFAFEAPQEYGRLGPVWQVRFGPQDAGTFYVDALTGDIRAVRTSVWRVYDFFWGLHIMDWSSRENFNSWWVRMTASVALLFSLAGAGLAGLRIVSIARRHWAK